MRINVILSLVIAAAPPAFGQSIPGPDVDKTINRITSADFPKAAQRLDFFEERINSQRTEDREAVVSELARGWLTPDKETVALLKRVLKHDPDPAVRGLAVHTLHDAWIALAPDELPITFTGYHREQLLDRRAEALCDDLIAQVRRGGVEAGYAASLGLLRCKKAVPELRSLAESSNEFVRYSAGRALIECGDKKHAGPILKTLMSHGVPPKAAIRDIVDPHYQALAARAYMELGAAEKRAGIERLIGLMKELASWQDINAGGRLDTARRMLAAVSGQFFTSHQEARAWHAKTIAGD
jgi:HEAT repeat protein